MENFISKEKLIDKQLIFKTLFRFLWELKHLRYIFFPTLIVITICAALPQYFLWYTGKYLNHISNGLQETGIEHILFNTRIIIEYSIRVMWFIAFLTLFTRYLSWSLFELSGKWSNQLIHSKMMHSLSGTRTTFYDENPSGRMINRIIGDYFKLDWAIITVGDLLNISSELLCMGILIFIVSPIPALCMIPLLIFYIILQNHWTPMLSHNRELNSIAFGDVVHRETDLIDGIEVFALYNHEKDLVKKLYQAFLKSVNIRLHGAKLQWWGEMWMSVISISFGLVVYIFIVMGIHSKTINPVFAAIIITGILSLTDILGFLNWQVTRLGERAANVRRIFEYIDLPHESLEEKKERAITSNKTRIVPGDITFKNYTMSYRNSGPVILKNLSLTLKKGKKIGIVGKTGAGKTSILQSLFRMVYVQKGDILIGGTSIFNYEVDTLRNLFGVVPQDPYLFSGNIEFNLSGGNPDITHARMEEALRKVKLNLTIDAKVSEGGADYSVGERQLLCLARILISEKPYIFMDEPTSSVDMITDAKIQKVLDSYLSDRTVITIAHRLESLYHYDYIIEFKDGKFFRSGIPGQLIPEILKDNGYH